MSIPTHLLLATYQRKRIIDQMETDHDGSQGEVAFGRGDGRGQLQDGWKLGKEGCGGQGKGCGGSQSE